MKVSDCVGNFGTSIHIRDSIFKNTFVENRYGKIINNLVKFIMKYVGELNYFMHIQLGNGKVRHQLEIVVFLNFFQEIDISI